jgi:2-oxoglutarate ferredoxin oxidoreductase subunit gamma
VGNVLATAAANQGLHTTWLPIYGVEKRGGEATCTVLLSQNPIESPVVGNPSTVVILHPKILHYDQRVRTGGRLILNTSLVDPSDVSRDDVEIIGVPATEMAADLGGEKAANVVLLGLLVKLSGILSLDSVREVLESTQKDKKVKAINNKALEAGYQFVS